MATEPTTSEVTIRESPYRKLGYANEFKAMLHEHPGIVKTAIGLTQQAEAEYNPSPIRYGKHEFKWNPNSEWEYSNPVNYSVSGDPEQRNIGPSILFNPSKPLKDAVSGLEVILLGKRKTKTLASRRGRNEDTSYFKMSIAGESFFVKKSSKTTKHGFDEFQKTFEVAKALQNIENIQVVDAQLGYADNTQSWFVSRWNDLESQGFFPVETWTTGISNNYNQKPSEEKDHPWITSELINQVSSVSKGLLEKAREAGISLEDIEMNLFLNPDTGKYFLLDVTTSDQRSLNQPEPQKF